MKTSQILLLLLSMAAASLAGTHYPNPLAEINTISVSIYPSKVGSTPISVMIEGSLVTPLSVDDKILIYLPQQITVLVTTSCQISSTSTISSSSTCKLSKPNQLIRIVLVERVNAGFFSVQITGDIQLGYSAQITDSFQFQTYLMDNNEEADSQNTDILVEIQPGSMASVIAQVKSGASLTVGEPTTLSISFVNEISTPAGSVLVLELPAYFQNQAKSILLHQVDTDLLSCKYKSVTTSCSYDESLQQIKLTEVFSNKINQGTTISIEITGILNSISTTNKTVVQMKSLNDQGGLIESGSFSFQPQQEAIIEGYIWEIAEDDIQIVTNHTIKFNVPVPMEQNCQIKVYYPADDFDFSNVGGLIVKAYGLFGLLRTLGHTVSVSERLIQISDACEEPLYSVDNQAVLALINIQNPLSTKQTGKLQILIENEQGGAIASNVLDTSPVSEFNTISAVQGGFAWTNLNMTSKEIDTESTLQIYFEPGDSIQGTAKFVLTIEYVAFTLESETIVNSTTFENILDGTTLYDVNDTHLVVTVSDVEVEINKGYIYDLLLGNITLSGSTQDLGSFFLQTFLLDQASGVYYLVDEGTISHDLSLINGHFLLLEATPLSLITSITTSYTFKVQAEHTIPLNGTITVEFPVEMELSGSVYCKYLSQETECKYKSKYHSVEVSGPFLAGDMEAETSFQFTIYNIGNPRSLETSSSFNFSTANKDGNLIDTAEENYTVTVTMTTPVSIQDLDISAVESYRVGDVNNKLTFSILSQIEILDQDQLVIYAPEQFLISTITSCTVGMTFPNETVVSKSSQECYVRQLRTLAVTFQVEEWAGVEELPSGSQIKVKIGGFINPSNGAPTDPFTFTFNDQEQYQIAKYSSSSTFLSMRDPYLVTTPPATISSTNSIPGYPTDVTINFFNAHELTSSDQIWITHPVEVTVDSSTLMVTLSTVPVGEELAVSYSSTSRRIKIYSDITPSTIIANQNIKVEILSGILNSQEYGDTPSFVVQTFTKEGYVIDMTNVTLSLFSQCQYPCETCDEPTECLSCLAQEYSEFYLLEEQTCLQECSSGYYQFTDSLDPACLPCDNDCKTCQGSSSNCTSCKQDQFLRPGGICSDSCLDGYFKHVLSGECRTCKQGCLTCDGAAANCTSCELGLFLFQNDCLEECPLNQTDSTIAYVANEESRMCESCIEGGCKSCEGTISNCTSCFPEQKLDLLFRTCVTSCDLEVTADLDDGFCTPCNESCEGCADTDPNYCETCITGLYLHNNTCHLSCPTSYSTHQYSSENTKLGLCMPCDEGCLTCIDGNSSHCPTCISPLFSLDFAYCVEACPLGYMQSSDSGVCIDLTPQCSYGYTPRMQQNGSYFCELTSVICDDGYELNDFWDKCIPSASTFLPFPNVILATGVTSIMCFIVWSRGYKHTQKITTTIQIWCLAEILIYLQQMILAAAYNFWAIFSLSLVGIIFQICLNFFSHWYFSHKEQKDRAFQHWTSTFPRAIVYYHNLQRFVSFRAFVRCYSSRLFHLPYFDAAFSFPQPHLYKPLIRLSVLAVVLVHLPILVASLLALVTVQWPYQLLIASIEAMVAIAVVDTLTLVEIRQNSRDNQAPYFKIEPKDFTQQQNVMGRMEDSREQLVKDEKVFPVSSAKKNRKAILEQINADLDKRKAKQLNFQHMDDMLTSEREGLVVDKKIGEQLKKARAISLQGEHGERFDTLERDSIEDLKNERNSVGAGLDDKQRAEYEDMEEMGKARNFFWKLNKKFKQKREQERKQKQLQEQVQNEDEIDYSQVKQLHRPKYELREVTGEFLQDKKGNFLILKDAEGNLVDQNGRRVNKSGYLVDKKGNIIDQKGKIVVMKHQLLKGGAIPDSLYRQLFLPRYSSDSLSHHSQHVQSQEQSLKQQSHMSKSSKKSQKLDSVKSKELKSAKSRELNKSSKSKVLEQTLVKPFHEDALFDEVEIFNNMEFKKKESKMEEKEEEEKKDQEEEEYIMDCYEEDFEEFNEVEGLENEEEKKQSLLEVGDDWGLALQDQDGNFKGTKLEKSQVQEGKLDDSWHGERVEPAEEYAPRKEKYKVPRHYSAKFPKKAKSSKGQESEEQKSQKRSVALDPKTPSNQQVPSRSDVIENYSHIEMFKVDNNEEQWPENSFHENKRVQQKRKSKKASSGGKSKVSSQQQKQTSKRSTAEEQPKKKKKLKRKEIHSLNTSIGGTMEVPETLNIVIDRRPKSSSLGRTVPEIIEEKPPRHSVKAVKQAKSKEREAKSKGESQSILGSTSKFTIIKGREQSQFQTIPQKPSKMNSPTMKSTNQSSIKPSYLPEGSHFPSYTPIEALEKQLVIQEKRLRKRSPGKFRTLDFPSPFNLIDVKKGGGGGGGDAEMRMKKPPTAAVHSGQKYAQMNAELERKLKEAERKGVVERGQKLKQRRNVVGDHNTIVKLFIETQWMDRKQELQ